MAFIVPFLLIAAAIGAVALRFKTAAIIVGAVFLVLGITGCAVALLPIELSWKDPVAIRLLLLASVPVSLFGFFLLAMGLLKAWLLTDVSSDFSESK